MFLLNASSKSNKILTFPSEIRNLDMYTHLAVVDKGIGELGAECFTNAFKEFILNVLKI